VKNITNDMYKVLHQLKKNLPIFPLLWMCPGIIPILHSPGYNREILLCTIIHVEQQENLVHGQRLHVSDWLKY
jgi:hypothetical protein